MSLPDDELNTFPWRNTFKKQQRVLIKREKQRVEEDVGDDCENADTISDASKDASDDFERVLPGIRRASPPDSAAAVNLVSDDSDTDEVSPPILPLMGKQKARSPTPEVTDNNDEALICKAMASVVVSSPPKQPTPPLPSFTTPGKRGKHYVVSIGRRAGVFDNWAYTHSLVTGVPGNCFKSYQTYDEACGVYCRLKEQGLVKIVRKDGDEAVFGPLEDAVL